jgi:hypothetical protein
MTRRNGTLAAKFGAISSIVIAAAGVAMLAWSRGHHGTPSTLALLGGVLAIWIGLSGLLFVFKSYEKS